MASLNAARLGGVHRHYDLDVCSGWSHCKGCAILVFGLNMLMWKLYIIISFVGVATNIQEQKKLKYLRVGGKGKVCLKKAGLMVLQVRYPGCSSWDIFGLGELAVP